MTQAIISAVVKKLADLLVNEVRSLGGVDSKVDGVKLQLNQMHCFLKDADSKKKTGDERFKGWVRDVRSVAYEIEDAIDAFFVEANYRWLGLIPNGLLARRTLGEKISKIQAQLRIISEGKITFGIQDLTEDRGSFEGNLETFKRPVLPDIHNSEVVGFEAEKAIIIGLLLHGPSDKSRRVVSVVGPGGLGKTTLAQTAYTCSTVRKHFDSFVWITVSRDFNIVDLLKKIYKQLEYYKQLKGESQNDLVAYLLGEVNTLLKRKRYLIVLDDVWSEDVFTQLEPGLVDVKNGSRVLITSRSLNVANSADPSGVHCLRFLNEEESLGLFLKKALRSNNPSPKCPEQLSHIAEKLVKRCDGLPLALIVLGGLLSTHRQWSNVHQRLGDHVQKCIEILATSYDDLPYLLKSCFRYLACFPDKDYKIPAKPLMKMWIAEGLIEVKGEGQLEDYAEDYLEELVQRCLVQVVERYPNGAIKYVKVHDLLRAVAFGEATENDFLFILKEENAGRDVSMARRVAFHEGNDASGSINDPKDLRKINMPKLRTFLNFDRRNVVGIGFHLLRVLELRNTQSFNGLPMDLKSMINLRYLGLRGTAVTVIPTWIGHLKNLQTFDIKGTQIKKLPKSFWKITSLRHVHSSAIDESVGLVGPPSTANLVNLRSLGRFIVPKSWEKSFPHLLGVRKLQLCCHDENDGMLILVFISKLNNLLSVRLDKFDPPPRGIIDFGEYYSPSYQNIHTMYLSGKKNSMVTIVELPPNITKLTLSTFLLTDPMWRLEKLHSLKNLELYDVCIEAWANTIVSRNGGFPQLQSLKLDIVYRIEQWEVEPGALPVLKYLLVKSCNSLRTLPDLRLVRTLQELRLDGELLSRVKNRSEFEWFKVKHIPTVNY